MWKVFPSSEFESAKALWQEVATRTSASVLLSFDFVFPLLKAFGSGQELLAIYEGQSGPEAATLVHRIKPGVWSTFQPTEACLGIWLQSENSNQLSLVLELMRRLPGFPIVFAITQQDPKISQRPRDSSHIRTIDYIKTAWINMTGSFDQYWAARGKNLRTNMKRAHRELTNAGIQARLEVITKTEDVRGAIETYSRLEANGWKGKAGTAVQLDNAQGQFYQEMLESACKRGIGKIYRYSLGDSTVAMDLCIEDNNNLVILKTAYDEQYAQVSPASLMRENQLQLIFGEGRMQRIEFYGPVMDWHTKWTKEERGMYHINFYRYRFLPMFQKIGRRSKK